MIIWVVKIFFVQFCVLLPVLLNIFCFCEVHTISVLYCTHLCMKYSLGNLIFLKRSLVFPILLFSSISLHWSLRKSFLPLLVILWNPAMQMGISFLFSFAFHFLFFTAICKASSDSHFAFLHFFFWEWSWSLSPVQYHEPPSIVLQALCLSDLICWIYTSLPLYNHKGFDLGHNWMTEWSSLLSSI